MSSMNVNEILNGAKTAFIDEHLESNLDFRPKLLSNTKNTKVSNAIRDELLKCDEFFISSAFIKSGAITSLKNEFEYLEKNNIKGRITPNKHRIFIKFSILKSSFALMCEPIST